MNEYYKVNKDALSNYVTKQSEQSVQFRLYQLNKDDVIFIDTIGMERLGYTRKLVPGDRVHFNRHLCRAYYTIDLKNVSAIVTKVYKHKKYPNKKWWQFWLKQEEYTDGYNLMIL